MNNVTVHLPAEGGTIAVANITAKTTKDLMWTALCHIHTRATEFIRARDMRIQELEASLRAAKLELAAAMAATEEQRTAATELARRLVDAQAAKTETPSNLAAAYKAAGLPVAYALCETDSQKRAHIAVKRDYLAAYAERNIAARASTGKTLFEAHGPGVVKTVDGVRAYHADNGEVVEL